MTPPRTCAEGLLQDCDHTRIRGTRCVKSVAVTPNAAVSPEPSAEPTKAPPFRIDISVANSVASTPCQKKARGKISTLQLEDHSQ